MRFNNNCNHFKPSMAKYKRFIDSTYCVSPFIDIDCSYIEEGRWWIVLEDKHYKIKNEKSAKFKLNNFKEWAKNYNLPFLGLMIKSIVPDIDKHEELKIAGNARVPINKSIVVAMITNFYKGERLETPIVIDELTNNTDSELGGFNFKNLQACIFEWLDKNNLITEIEKQQYRESANKLFGKTLNENELKSQMELRLLTYPGGINNSVLRWKGDLITADQWLYFDKDMNRLGKRNGGGALFFVRADGDGRERPFYK